MSNLLKILEAKMSSIKNLFSQFSFVEGVSKENLQDKRSANVKNFVKGWGVL